jgi:hypothetical protein
MKKYKKYLYSYATELYYVPSENHGTCPDAPDPEKHIPAIKKSKSQWATYLMTTEGSNNYYSLPDCSHRHVFYCGSYDANWSSNGIIKGPYLGIVGSANYGIVLVFWDDINFDTKGSNACSIVDKVLLGVTIHELMHLYTTGTGDNHCTNTECLMYVNSSDYDYRWLPFKSSNFPWLCNNHAEMLTKYENRSIYNWCTN